MTKTRILLFGATGQLARELLAMSGDDFELMPVSRAMADFSDPQVPAKYLLSYPDCDLVVNATGYTAVDKAEQEEGLATAVNGEAVGALAQVCATRGVPLIHVSTDYVFDGSKSGAYVEDDPVGPLGAYGRSKLAGEELVRAALAEHVILRTSWVYSPYGANFVKTMLRLGAEREELRVVDDQNGSPTAAGDIARAILKIAARIRDGKAVWGTFHYCGEGVTTWRRFAEEIFAQARALGLPVKARVTPIPSSAYPTPATRPMNSALRCDKICKAYDMELQPWPKALATVLLGIQQERSVQS